MDPVQRPGALGQPVLPLQGGVSGVSPAGSKARLLIDPARMFSAHDSHVPLP
jgi:hypothetical protein